MCLLTVPTLADDRIRFDTYDVEDGLSGEPVLALLQDHVGYLWIGTAAGLDRYDGYAFESFAHSPNIDGSATAQAVLALLEDHRGRLWIGGERGLGLFDRALQTFRDLPLPSEAAGADGPGDELEPPEVRALFEDRDQVLWIGTDQGLFRLPLGSREPQASDIRVGFDGLLPSPSDLPDRRIYAIAEDREGRLWIAGRAGLLRLDGRGGRPRLDHFAYDEQNPESLHDDEVYTLLVDRAGDLWIGAWGGGGLGRVTGDQLGAESPRFERFIYPDGDPRAVPDGVVKSLLEDRQGNLWIGTQREGLCRLTEIERERSEPRFHCIRHDPLDPSSAPRAQHSDLLQDDQGNIWIAGAYGLTRHVPRTAEISLIHPRPQPGAAPGSINVASVGQSEDGSVWIGTREGLERVLWDEESGAVGFELFKPDEKDPNGLSAPWIYALEQDRRGRLWLGTVLGGLQRMVSPQAPQPRFRTYGVDDGLAIRSVFAIHEDRDARLWVGTYRGLFFTHLDESGEPTGFSLWSQDELLKTSLVYALFEDSKRRLWIATDDGLHRLSPDRGRLDTQLVRPGLIVQQILETPDGHLWMASSAGLVDIDLKTDESRLRSGSESMAEAVAGLAVDPSGNIWFTTARHLHRLNPASGELRRFEREDGLSVLPFGAGAFLAANDGRFYLGGVHGVAVFRPERLGQEPLLAPVVPRRLGLASGPVTVSPDGPLTQSLDTTDVLILPPEETLFTLEFSALSFYRQDALHYAYRLLGYSDEWIETKADARRATFTNLPPGDYVFEARAKADVGSWSPKPARLDVRILPYWYETTTFRLLFAGLALGLPALWVRHRFRRLERRRRELQELVDRWQIERQERRRWQELTVTAARLAQDAKRCLESLRRSTDGTDAERLNERATELSRAERRLEDLLAFLDTHRPTVGPLQLSSLLRDVVDELRDELQKARVHVRCEVSSVHVLADRALLTQMLTHMIRSRLQSPELEDPPSRVFSFELESRATDDAPDLRTAALYLSDEPDPAGPGAAFDIPLKTDRLDLSLAEKLAEQQDLTLNIDQDPPTGARIHVKGLRLVS